MVDVGQANRTVGERIRHHEIHQFFTEKKNGKSKGCAIVEFTSSQSALLCAENLNKRAIDGKACVVTLAPVVTAHSASGGIGGSTMMMRACAARAAARYGVERSGADERRRRTRRATASDVDDAGAVERAAAATKDETVDDAAANEGEAEQREAAANLLHRTYRCL